MAIMHDTVIIRFTTRFSADEDRIALDCEAAGGSVFCYWLTRRLSDKFLAALLNVAERIDPGPAVPPVAQTLWRAQAQNSVQLAMAKTPPVERSALVAGYLVQSVQINQPEEGVRLKFVPRHGPSADLTLSMTQLLQWLKIIYDSYQAAEWEFSLWPEWFLDINAPVRPLGVNVVH